MSASRKLWQRVVKLRCKCALLIGFARKSNHRRKQSRVDVGTFSFDEPSLSLNSTIGPVRHECISLVRSVIARLIIIIIINP